MAEGVADHDHGSCSSTAELGGLDSSGSAGSAGRRMWEARLEWVIGAPVEAVWEVTGDFLGMERWAPSVVTQSELLEGRAGEAGCVRRVKGPSSPVLGDSPCSTERLLGLDPAARTMTYVVLSSTAPSVVGLTPTFQLLPENPSATSTRIVWSYLIPPIPGLQEDAFHQLAKPLYDLAISDLKKTMSLD